jgi:MATE family multidrug resistance protein
VVAIALAGYMMIDPRYRPLRIFSRLAPVRPKVLREIIVLGFPIAIMITAEAGLFNAVSILIGTRGPLISAAHQIAIVFASTMFMIPLAMSSAITIRVGQMLGKRDLQGARLSGATGIFLCGLFMTCSAILLLVFRDVVVSAFTSDTAVKGIALSLLLMAAIFQVVDGIQIGAAGALRGYKDTRLPMVINTFAFWVLAFPLAYMAAVTFRSPPNYIWGGFIVGLTVAAALLSWRFQKVSKSYQLPA